MAPLNSQRHRMLVLLCVLFLAAGIEVEGQAPSDPPIDNGLSRAIVSRVSPWIGIQRTCVAEETRLNEVPEKGLETPVRQ